MYNNVNEYSQVIGIALVKDSRGGFLVDFLPP